ncbi:MAG: thiamine diphosphokinase [Stomatobaculum sp.]|nr:thiamine diphosphokinase [Stomatobaculum sp.]
MKTGIILAGGDLTPEFAEKIIAEYRRRGAVFLAAADAGLEICVAAGMTPDLLLGDFDTVKQEVLQDYLGREDLSLEQHNPVKDASDLELCADSLMARGIKDILVLGALGGRADHTLANIRMTYYAMREGMDLTLLDPQNRIRCIRAEGNGRFSIPRITQWGKYVGLFPIGATSVTIDLEGFRYPLKDFVLSDAVSPSFTISNEITAESGVIRFRGPAGAGLIIIESKDRARP